MPHPCQLVDQQTGPRHRAGTRLPAMIVLVMILLWVASVNAQKVIGPEEEPPSIDKGIRAEIIDSVSATLNKIYVFPDVARKMEKHMRKRLKEGAYDDLTNTADFTQKISDELREISKDGHLRVRFIPDTEFERFLPDSLTDDERKRREAEFLERLEYDNFGFVKAERMSGNVGYLRFDGFEDAKHGGATAVAALNFLAYCDALIIDMRNNGGGAPSMIQLITSYFFDESVHLNSFYIREQDSIQQFWTQEQVQGPRMSDVDLYVLTSNYTFSAAEEFTYNLKNLKRATIIGETTGGGAHPTNRYLFADLNVAMSCPFGRAINPITGINWEGTGIDPHIPVPQDQALDVAHVEAMKKLAEKTPNEEIRETLLWNIETKETLLNPVTVAPGILKSYAGSYGPRTITFENGILYYQRENRPRMRMIPMAENLFCFEDIDYFRLKVNVNDEGMPVELVGLYAGGHTDLSPRDPGQ